jgi:hypothetical protein
MALSWEALVKLWQTELVNIARPTGNCATQTGGQFDATSLLGEDMLGSLR